MYSRTAVGWRITKAVREYYCFPLFYISINHSHPPLPFCQSLHFNRLQIESSIYKMQAINNDPAVAENKGTALGFNVGIYFNEGLLLQWTGRNTLWYIKQMLNCLPFIKEHKAKVIKEGAHFDYQIQFSCSTFSCRDSSFRF